VSACVNKSRPVFFPVGAESFCGASSLSVKKLHPNTVLRLAFLHMEPNYRRETEWMRKGEAEPCAQNPGTNLVGFGSASLTVV